MRPLRGYNYCYYLQVDKNSDQSITLDEYLVADAEWLTKVLLAHFNHRNNT